MILKIRELQKDEKINFSEIEHIPFKDVLIDTQKSQSDICNILSSKDRGHVFIVEKFGKIIALVEILVRDDFVNKTKKIANIKNFIVRSDIAKIKKVSHELMTQLTIRAKRLLCHQILLIKDKELIETNIQNQDSLQEIEFVMSFDLSRTACFKKNIKNEAKLFLVDADIVDCLKLLECEVIEKACWLKESSNKRVEWWLKKVLIKSSLDNSQRIYYFHRIRQFLDNKKMESKYQITSEEFFTLWSLAQSNKIVIKKYKTELDGFSFEVFLYEKDDKQLWVAKVLFNELFTINHFSSLSYFIKEITDNSEFDVNNLILYGFPLQI